MSGETLIIEERSKVFNFRGAQMWKVSEQIEFYRLYVRSFKFK
jgi:hypothetical protein